MTERDVEMRLYGIRSGAVRVIVPVVSKWERAMIFSVMAENSMRDAFFQKKMWEEAGA